MGKVCWDFPLLGTGNETGNNIAAITMFKGTGIMDGLAREICQNSLDAKNKALPDNDPVRVVFELVEIEKNKFDLFKGYEDAIDNCIAYWNKNPLSTEKIRDFLNSIKHYLNSSIIPMLNISDYNTVGLKGVNAADNEISYWDLLVNSEGISIKQDDTSAGSFGIGKNAPFAYSALNLVVYNTLAEDGGRAFEGVTHLVTSQREHNGKFLKTQNTGKYLFLEDEYNGRPIIPKDDCHFSQIDAFNRSDIGTDVAIVGFNSDEYENWEKQTAISILKNFILSIYYGKLEVTIKSNNVTYDITKNKLTDYLYKTFANEDALKSTKQIYETIRESQPINVKIADDNDLSIYVKYNEMYAPTLSRFRSTGMLINTSSEVIPRYSVVIIVNDVGEMDLSKTLREAEPPQHTEWSAKYITNNPELHKKAKRYIRRIKAEIQHVLDSMDNSTPAESMDAGVGDYLPGNSDNDSNESESDGIRSDVRVESISDAEGRILYRRNYSTGESGTGDPASLTAVKTGKKKRKKKKKKQLATIKSGSSSSGGVSSGSNPKLKVTTPLVFEHRIFYKAANKYQLYINAPKDYDSVYFKFFAGRDDGGQDEIAVKNYKLANKPRIAVESKRIGPIPLSAGPNTVFIEFTLGERIAIIPEFTREVHNG